MLSMFTATPKHAWHPSLPGTVVYSDKSKTMSHILDGSCSKWEKYQTTNAPWKKKKETDILPFFSYETRSNVYKILNKEDGKVVFVSKAMGTQLLLLSVLLNCSLEGILRPFPPLFSLRFPWNSSGEFQHRKRTCLQAVCKSSSDVLNSCGLQMAHREKTTNNNK